MLSGRARLEVIFQESTRATQVSKGSLEELVHPEGEPVTAILSLVVGVGQFVDNQSVGFPGQ